MIIFFLATIGEPSSRGCIGASRIAINKLAWVLPPSPLFLFLWLGGGAVVQASSTPPLSHWNKEEVQVLKGLACV